MDGPITPLLMPRWGIDMVEGRVSKWLVAEGTRVEPGADVVEVESEKTVGAVESAGQGVLRRQVAREGEMIPVGALLGVLAPATVPDGDIDVFVSGFRAPSRDAVSFRTQDETVEVLGHSLRLLSLGSGDLPVLLLHGFGGDLRGWGPVQMALARVRRTISLDLPGHGGSTKTLASAEPRFFQDLIIGLLQALGLSKVHLVGHSWGGELAWGVAKREPRTVASLTLIGTAGPATPADARYVQEFLAATRRAEVKTVLQQLFADPALVTREMVEQTLRYKRIEAVDEALRRIAAAALATPLAGTDLSIPPVPIQIIAGGQDRVCPLGDDFTPPDGVTLHRLPHVGHMPQLEASAEVASLIDAFLSSRAHVTR